MPKDLYHVFYDVSKLFSVQAEITHQINPAPSRDFNYASTLKLSYNVNDTCKHEHLFGLTKDKLEELREHLEEIEFRRVIHLLEIFKDNGIMAHDGMTGGTRIAAERSINTKTDMPTVIIHKHNDLTHSPNWYTGARQVLDQDTGETIASYHYIHGKYIGPLDTLLKKDSWGNLFLDGISPTAFG